VGFDGVGRFAFSRASLLEKDKFFGGHVFTVHDLKVLYLGPHCWSQSYYLPSLVLLLSFGTLGFCGHRSGCSKIIYFFHFKKNAILAHREVKQFQFYGIYKILKFIIINKYYQINYEIFFS
jgi:hypothetical protein